MSKITDLKQYKTENTPHISGPAKCLVCKHEWVAVVPLDAHVCAPFLQCPECATCQGVFNHPPIRSDGCVWKCTCGCDTFRYSPIDGWYCSHCAALADPP